MQHYFACRLLASQYGPKDGGVRFQIPATNTLHDKDDSFSNSDSDMDTDEDDDTHFPQPPSHPASSTKVRHLP